MTTTFPEVGLTETEIAMRDVAHRFALDIIRPAGIKMDRMSPDVAYGATSPLWHVMKTHRALGLDLWEVSQGLTPVEIARLEYLVYEEMGWGDVGLAFTCWASFFPAILAKATGNKAIEAAFPFSQIGCWSITEPNYGTDMLDFTDTLRAPEHGGLKSNCVARRQGDKIIISGQKAAWATMSYISDSMSLFCRYDDGSNKPQWGAFLVPLNLPGVSRGKPLDKLGTRTLVQSEIFFDDVTIPAEYMVIKPENYRAAVKEVLVSANPRMGITFIGAARAAYEYALAYSKERIQGGRPIFEYQAVKLKLFEMFRKIEAARALCRHVMEVHAGNDNPRFELCVSAKVTATIAAIEVTNAAFEIFGGNAVTKEYPIEKLLRDCRLGTVADGTNDILSLMATSFL